MEKGKIVALQMCMMMYPAIIATAILAVPGITARFAKQDLWLSPIWASLIGILTLFIVIRLYKLFPQQSFFQICEQTIGKFTGKLLGLIYFYFLILNTGSMTRTYGEFIAGAFFAKTPKSVIMVSILILSAFAVLGGIEVVGRLAQIFFPIFSFSIFIIFILLIPAYQPGNIMPILENGLLPSLKGAMVPQAWFGETFIIIFLLPFLTDAKKGLKWGMITVFIVLLTMVTTNIAVLFILGHNTAENVYPMLVATRFVNLGEFIENLDPVIIAVWVLGEFVKITVFYYVTALATAQWLNLSGYKPLVWPLGILIMEMSFWSLPNLMSKNNFDMFIFPFFSFVSQTLVPAFLLVIASMKKKVKGNAVKGNR
ncbi:spore germination protein [Bacillus sp. FJAT-29790]|uniref:GerAB/ArcD/ProY family transporter n=1 Tax=Bacillus sp. FJAT-29790 TaxID=1895002 RepID=UPI001C215F32|nr:endospore germination permease [Bacillus sp. FJAT-29790]MBU8880852.1 spore germination protein [Bacillus sp. FJAT-29790]